MAEVYSKEEIKEFVIQRLHLAPKTLGKTRSDVPLIIRDIGGFNTAVSFFGYRWRYPQLSEGIV